MYKKLGGQSLRKNNKFSFLFTFFFWNPRSLFFYICWDSTEKEIKEKELISRYAYTHINLGSTVHKSVITKLINLVSNDPLYVVFKDHFERMSFDDYSNCSIAFSSLIQLMEKVEIT